MSGALTYPPTNILRVNELIITDNAVLQNLSGFESIQMVASKLELTNNGNLTSLSGLSPSDISTCTIIIKGNSALSTLNLLSIKSSKTNTVTIENNDNVLQIELGQTLMTGLFIRNNAKLRNLYSAALVFVTGDIILDTNLALSLISMSNLASVQGNFSIRCSPLSTATLSGLSLVNNLNVFNVSLVTLNGFEVC